MVLDLLGLRYDAVEVPFGELVTLTNGYVQVPVLLDDTCGWHGWRRPCRAEYAPVRRGV